jgi:hypothetical protein
MFLVRAVWGKVVHLDSQQVAAFDRYPATGLNATCIRRDVDLLSRR